MNVPTVPTSNGHYGFYPETTVPSSNGHYGFYSDNPPVEDEPAA